MRMMRMVAFHNDNIVRAVGACVVHVVLTTHSVRSTRTDTVCPAAVRMVIFATVRSTSSAAIRT
jgi:hypothetical protein